MRIFYTTLLWLVWTIAMVWQQQLFWLERFWPLHKSVQLQGATHVSTFTVVYWVSVALVLAIPLRLWADNFRMNLLPLFTGATCALMGCAMGGENVQTLDQIGGEVAYTRQLVFRTTEVKRYSKGLAVYHFFDHPLQAGKLIRFHGNWMQGTVRDTLCVDVVEGKSGALWALLPKPCEGQPVRSHNLSRGQTSVVKYSRPVV